MVTSLAPSRHLGLNATYSNKWFWIAAGVFGPELKGAEEQTARLCLFAIILSLISLLLSEWLSKRMQKKLGQPNVAN